MRFTAIGTLSGVFAAAIALVPAGLQAQVHAQGSCWVQRNAPASTWLHSRRDARCLLQFPAACYRGMMMPDSLYCNFHCAPPESLPRGCAAACDLDIRDPQGECMMSGRMTFRLPLSFTLHYDPQVVAALGIPIANLVLIRPVSGGYEVVREATHDPDAALFHLSTVMPSTWYGVADRMNLPVAVAPRSWGNVKGAYR
jgi:hypothetical protein